MRKLLLHDKIYVHDKKSNKIYNVYCALLFCFAYNFLPPNILPFCGCVITTSREEEEALFTLYTYTHTRYNSVPRSLQASAVKTTRLKSESWGFSFLLLWMRWTDPRPGLSSDGTTLTQVTLMTGAT